MAHLDVQAELQTMAVTNAGNAWGFLQAFAPVHAQWHLERSQGQQSTGFLTFHKIAIDALLQAAGGTVQLQPSSILPYPPEVAALGQQTGELDAFAFSQEIEGWHNGVHMTVGNQIPQFMQPRINIFLQLFWDFHAFIDQQFDTMLAAYGLDWNSYRTRVIEDAQRWI